MIQLRTMLIPADNTGAKRLMLIHIDGQPKQKYARIGDKITCVIDQADSTKADLVKDSQIVKAVVIRTAKEMKRPDGSYIRFDDNAAVIIDKDGNPLGTRIFGPVAKEIKEKGYKKIVSLAQELV
ncbi:50S ribosomal protein L14 [Candidatus Shapirobacteria bacterium CG_4_10_14_0_8_um_filter_39_15]|nr:MAG: 50S ribosomal protein L14 [Candidatus Shapirobacteria bacterium CG_4_10_14_0_8_um_filter_39_15]PJE68385.1 MAG: 50S ribosomal protein L14 [Candidatus Shapirobacteria bacterium CG10_big_fil_rev_8_21_14_0_10_38_8]